MILFPRFILENLQLNDSCELTEQCLRPLSVCFQEKCKCMSGYSAFNEDNCIKGLQTLQKLFAYMDFEQANFKDILTHLKGI